MAGVAIPEVMYKLSHLLSGQHEKARELDLGILEQQHLAAMHDGHPTGAFHNRKASMLVEHKKDALTVIFYLEQQLLDAQANGDDLE